MSLAFLWAGSRLSRPLPLHLRVPQANKKMRVLKLQDNRLNGMGAAMIAASFRVRALCDVLNSACASLLN